MSLLVTPSEDKLGAPRPYLLAILNIGIPGHEFPIRPHCNDIRRAKTCVQPRSKLLNRKRSALNLNVLYRRRGSADERPSVPMVEDPTVATLRNRLSPPRTGAAVLIGGGAAGLLDIIFALVRNGLLGIPPHAVLQSVASGIWGRAAYHGGSAMALVGLLLHFAMTVAMAAIFAVIFQRIAMARRHWLVSGLLFGLVVYIVMSLVVVPLSRFPRGSIPFSLWALAAHLFLVGLPISFAARRLRPPATNI
jgi:uncharacterized membrane protein YagU involved in acid resistance